MTSKRNPRVKITLTLPADLAKWVDEKVKDREYATRSHAFEVAILELRKNNNNAKTNAITKRGGK
jgi:metal-responsive CopG/Arc/MetJ family transcriptional regulator